MTKTELVKRYILFFTGLFLLALGISLTTKAGLGTTPISSLPYVLSIGFPMTFGQFTFFINVFFILAQIIILRKDFEKIQYLQILVVVPFSFFIDLTTMALSFLKPSSYVEQLIILLAGCVIIGLGTYMQILANVLINAGEGIVRAIAFKAKKEFGSMKIVFDTTCVLIAIITSYYLLSNITGVREGTVISAFLIGYTVRFFSRLFQKIRLEKYIYGTSEVSVKQ